MVSYLEPAGRFAKCIDDAPPETQRKLLREILEHSEEVKQRLLRIHRAWQNSDLDKLDGFRRERNVAHPEIYGSILDDRNREWLPQLLQALESSEPVLIAVGALHFTGKTGLLNELSERGHEVSKVA